MDVQWPLLIFGLLGGLSMGCLGFVCASILTGKAASLRLSGLVVSLIALVVGGLASALHMGNPARIFHILANVQSGIAQELIACVVAGIVVLALLVLVVKQSSGAAIKTVAVLGLIVAVAFPFITGKAYMQGARPAWDTVFLPIMFIGAAAAMGAFALYLIAAIKGADTEEKAFIGKAAFFATVTFAVTMALYLVAIAVAPYPDPSRSLSRLLSGDLALMFWLFAVVLGLVLPLLVSGTQLFAGKSGAGTAAFSNSTVIALGLCGVLAGSAAIRMIMYLMGSSIQSFIY
ncbi:DmsC/YnfH family molybdoenzyme membrane anchor subunit [Raoultibacter phocaeensis]|uniref:DmsC/YnfH family molybdoenzyme membrane anchor subunit n=1 Tax=Raoultibacter phocaeensis TaxID=2479841 RepID=UPI00111862B3|nr:DmsC/YnfH family molybdoenzyme membrane anchor subunit [Raoultibacter phocaeensis]